MKLFAIGLACLASVAALAAPPAPIQVMMLGMYHMDNPGLDLHNVAAEDVRTPRRQAELARLAASLATFRPTKVMVEALGTEPTLDVPAYAKFTPAELATSRDETVQIGFRLAALTHASVHGIDVRSVPGERDYFPYEKVEAWAAAHGRKADLDALSGRVGKFASDFEAVQSRKSVAELLAIMNGPTSFNSSNDFYYDLLTFGDTHDQPGAELNSGWYERNAKIFAKLMTVAKPGDRIVIIFGAGHDYWQRHFASQTPGYVSVDAMPYLAKAR